MSKVIDLLFGKEKYSVTDTLDIPIQIDTVHGFFTITYQVVHVYRRQFGITWSRKRLYKGWVFLTAPKWYVPVLEGIENRWFDKTNVHAAIAELVEMSSNISPVHRECKVNLQLAG